MVDREDPSVPGVPGAGFVLVVVIALVVAVVAMWISRTVSVVDYATMPEGVAIPDMRIDINRASASELTVLPQIGEALAARIVEDRERNGPYGTMDELVRVPMIGPRTVERIRPYAVAEPVE